MSENLVIYAGTDGVGRLKVAAVKREARRQGSKVSVAEVVWDVLRRHGSPELKADLAAAEKARLR